VTTKKGKSGQPTIAYDAYYGVQLPQSGNALNQLGSPDFARLSLTANPQNSLYVNGLPDFMYGGPGVAGIAQAGDPAMDPAKYVFDLANPENNYLIQAVNKTGTNWYDELFNPAPIQNHNLTASGGTDRSQYLFSVSYFNQQGTLIETYLKRYSARVNTQFNVKDNIRLGENLYVFYRSSPGFDNQSEGNAVNRAYQMLPIIPVYDIRGNFGGTFAGPPELGSSNNPVSIQKRTVNNRSHAWDIVGNVFAEVDFLKRFTARTSFGGTVDNQYFYGFNFNQYNDRNSNLGRNSFNENARYNSSLMWTNTLTYNQLLGKHSLKVLLGSEAIRNNGRGVGGGSVNFFSTDPDYLVLGNGTSGVTNYSNAYINTLFSVFSRADYAFADKYLLGVTVRRDGSSVFGSAKRFGVFPSFSLGWRLSGENFMKNVSWINDLKIRGSYGVLGSQNNVNPTNAFSLYGSGFGTSYYDIGGTGNIRQGFYQTQNGNVNTGWEENIVTNLGLDATILQNLDFSLEYYKKSINGLLFPQPLPATAGGAATPTINIGDIQNQGVDVSLTYRGSIGSDLQYSVGTNLTTYRNKVVDIPDPGYFDAAGSRIGNLVRNQEGQPVSSFFAYQVEGLFRDQAEVDAWPTQTDAAPGRFKYRDVNGDNQISPDDRTFIGDPNPDFTYGVNLGASYKAFDVSAIFYGSQGNDIFNYMRFYTDFFSTFTSGKSNRLLDAWTPENTDTDIPKIEGPSSFSTSGVANSYYIENGSYLRLRSLIVGYTLPAGVLQRFRVGKLRVYAQVANLFTFTSYSGLDPELVGNSSNFGIDLGNYPNQRSILFGLNLSF
jgi:TonB-linked SusC/RagA family outer membrane protein